jgi:YidC/Oxa1 family membrane protein insertase
MLWITDLSAKDPYYITPILMTLTMWIQQKMTPATGDPAMRRVMNIMPFAMGFFFKDMPSGLVLYWLMQNVLTIVQQSFSPVHRPRPRVDAEGRRQGGLRVRLTKYF